MTLTGTGSLSFLPFIIQSNEGVIEYIGHCKAMFFDDRSCFKLPGQQHFLASDFRNGR